MTTSENRIVIHATAEGKTNIYRYQSEDITLVDWANEKARKFDLDKFKGQVINLETKDGFKPKLARLNCKVDAINSYCVVNTRGTRVLFVESNLKDQNQLEVSSYHKLPGF